MPAQRRHRPASNRPDGGRGPRPDGSDRDQERSYGRPASVPARSAASSASHFIALSRESIRRPSRRIVTSSEVAGGAWRSASANSSAVITGSTAIEPRIPRQTSESDEEEHSAQPQRTSGIVASARPCRRRRTRGPSPMRLRASRPSEKESSVSRGGPVAPACRLRQRSLVQPLLHAQWRVDALDRDGGAGGDARRPQRAACARALVGRGGRLVRGGPPCPSVAVGWGQLSVIVLFWVIHRPF